MKTLWEKGGGEATVALVHLTRPTCAKIGRKFDYHGFWGVFFVFFFFLYGLYNFKLLLFHNHPTPLVRSSHGSCLPHRKGPGLDFPRKIAQKITVKLCSLKILIEKTMEIVYEYFDD